MNGGPAAGAWVVSLTMARIADMLTWDPHSTGDDPSIFPQMAAYDRIVELARSNKDVQPELATFWTMSPDGLTATLRCKPARS
jgi:ABC-type transport system substrate-binding protein